MPKFTINCLDVNSKWTKLQTTGTEAQATDLVVKMTRMQIPAFLDISTQSNPIPLFETTKPTTQPQGNDLVTTRNTHKP